MLFLQMRSGEYLTIGDDIAVQVFRDGSERIRVAVKAPRELTVLRGELRERAGTERPDGLIQAVPGTRQRQSVSSG